MRFLSIAVIALLASCAQPTNFVVHKQFVVNSMWQVVATGEVSLAKGLEEETVTYNMSHTDDQRFVFLDEVPDISEAPDTNVYIVNNLTHYVYEQYLGVARTDLVDRKASWDLQASMVGGVLYVDRVPDLIVPPEDLRTLDEKYIVYGLDIDGHILYTRHCWTDGVSEADAIQLYNLTLTGFALQPEIKSIVSGRYYIDPTV